MSDIHSKRLVTTLVALATLTRPIAAANLQLTDRAVAPVLTNWKGVKDPRPKIGHYALPTGFTFDAILEGAIFSYNLMTPASAVLEDEIHLANDLVLPKRTRFIGTVAVIHTLDRINIDFHTCVFPDGQEIRINALALSPDGSAGVKGKVEKHTDVFAARVAMKTIVSGVQAGAALANPSVGNAMALGLTQEAAQTLETPNVKELESIFVEERAQIKIFLRERTEF